MNYKTYKQIESYYLDVEKHLFKSDKTFNEFLNSCINDDEMLNEWNISNDDLIQFIKDVSIDDEKNTTNKNKLVKHTIGNNYEVLTYNLKGNQSYTTHERVANKYIMNNYKILNSNVKRVVVGGLLSTTNNTRIYLYLNN